MLKNYICNGGSYFLLPEDVNQGNTEGDPDG